MLVANFTQRDEEIELEGLWQYDYGQKIQINGLDLPSVFEVHFAYKGLEEAVVQTGSTIDGISTVDIPNSVLTQPKTVSAYIYLSDAVEGETTNKILLYMNKRPVPEGFEAPEDIDLFHHTLAVMNETADRIAKSEKSAEAWTHGHADHPDRAEDNASYYAEKSKKSAESSGRSLEEVQEIAEQVQLHADAVEENKFITEQHKTQAAQASINAALSERNAKDSEKKAEQAKVDAETAEGQAQLFATQVSEDKTEIGQMKSDAEATARMIAEDKSFVRETVNDFVVKHEQAVTDINNAGQTQTERVQDAINDAGTIKAELSQVITQANAAKTNLSNATSTANTAKANLEESTSTANTAKTNLDASVRTANAVLQSLDSENSAADSNIEELRSENFNSQEILAGVADLRAYLGLAGDDVLGLQVDYKNKAFTRLAGAANLTAGADFDKFSMFGGRRRCNVADDGTITAWYGDADYKEDGSMGQVMVYQPKFYYLVCPVEYDPIDTGIGYHLRKANYYVSEKPRAGFRLHPAFYDANGNEIDYYLTSAYEGSIWDADGGDGSGAYLMNDEQVMDTTTDKFCSIAGVKPASGSTQELTRLNVEKMANNRGDGWHSDLIKQVSAEQMLMIIEMGTMNLQTAITRGVIQYSSNSTQAYTGSTADIGNGTGKATQTIHERNGTTTTETENGKTAVCWRGKENFWGNVITHINGVNIWGNGAMGGGQLFICTDFNFAESKNNENYEGAGFTTTNQSGYISAMGYSTKYDWLFIASECLGNSSLPVGDYVYIDSNLSAYTIPIIGHFFNSAIFYTIYPPGAFCLHMNKSPSVYAHYLGGRLVFIPTRDSAAYHAAIEFWKGQMQQTA